MADYSYYGPDGANVKMRFPYKATESIVRKLPQINAVSGMELERTNTILSTLLLWQL